MSQLNPNAAEFVPISPTRAVASPIGRVLCDEVLSESPKRAPPHEVDLNVPNPVDFDNDISQKPHEIDEGISNGHDLENDDELSARGLSKNRLDEFHFGPNAAPFTPVKLLDQSEASSTRAVYGDESVMTLGTSFNDSQDDLDRADLTAKDDPMTASFHQERDDVSNPFDPNKVHMLPDDDEEEVEDDLVHECNLSNSLMNDTISDLVEHFPLGKSDKENNPPVGFLVTDLDNDDHRSSSGNRVVSPLKSDRTESPLGDSRTESPSEHDRISIPFEEERSVSPIQDNKVSSPVEHGNLSPSSLGEDDSELCHLVAKSETPVLTGEKDDCFEKDEGIILEDTLEIHSPVQHEEVSSALQEADTICLKEDNQSIAEEKEITSTLEGDKEKCNIEEKEISSPLIEERERFMLEENFEVKKEKLIVEEKEVSSPLEDEDVLSQLESRDVKSPYEESGGVSPFGEERDVVSSSLGERDVISSSLEEKDVVSALEEKTENYPAYRDVVSPIKEINLTSPEEERALTSPVEEKDPISPMKESGLTSLVEERDLTSPLEDRGLTSAVEDGGLNAPVEERGLTSPTEDLTSPVEDTGSIPQVKEEGLTSPVEESYLNSPVQEMNLTSPVENLVTTSETQNEEMGISIEQIRESFSMQKSEEEKFTLLQTEEQKSELISAEQVYECSSESNKDGVLSEESKAEMEQKSENIPVEQKSEPVEDLKLSFQVDNEFSSSLEHRNKHLDLDDCLVKGEDGECLLQVDEIGRSGLANFGEVEGERLILSPLAPLHPPIPSDSEKLVKDIEKEEVVKVEILDVLNTGASSDDQSNVSAEQIMACIKAEADSSHDVVATKAPIDLPLSPVHSDKDDLLHSHPTPEYDQLLAQSYELSNTRSVVESSSVVETSSVIETSGLAQASSVLESSVDLESVATTEVNSFLGRSPLPEIQSPLSSNASYVIGEATGHSTADAPSLEPTKDCLSPPRTTIQEFTNLTSTPSNGRPSSLSPLASQVLLDVTAKSPSKLTPKDAEKKTTKSSKTTPSTATARKSLTAKSSLSATSKTSPSPRPAAPSKTSKPATTKTDSALASKAPPKPIAAPKTTTARVPLASRPVTKPAISNGLPKTVPKTNTVAPTKKSVEGTARSTTSAVGHKSTTTGPSKGPATSSKSSTTTGTASSARSSTATAAPPKPKTNSTRPAVPKPGTTTKTTSAVKPNASSTTSKVPTVSKSSTTSLTNRVPISARSQPAKSAHASTDKQIKETANKLTASKNTATARTTTTTKKIEEKSSTTKTTTKRTTATDSAAAAPAYRPPIRRPTAPSDTKTTATKVGKPKQNGVAAVVTEQIIVNKTNQQQRDSVELNGLANGDSLFVKDNSPVDNKLIVESKATTETAAN
ncbi:hypothetical protein WA026_007130 [Henosepilachna vigintioctopunctata]|uniref:Ataxin-2 C-terminal domain-containing protein n=1 Tax=Henosepilachna vigintioctopunctata TaxID=420089 RepID=A0AAW1V3T9_9CUCU